MTDYEYRTFLSFLDAQDLAGHDREMLILNCLQNAGDVPAKDQLMVVIETAKLYLDQGVDTF